MFVAVPSCFRSVIGFRRDCLSQCITATARKRPTRCIVQSASARATLLTPKRAVGIDRIIGGALGATAKYSLAGKASRTTPKALLGEL